MFGSNSCKGWWKQCDQLMVGNSHQHPYWMNWTGQSQTKHIYIWVILCGPYVPCCIFPHPLTNLKLLMTPLSHPGSAGLPSLRNKLKPFIPVSREDREFSKIWMCIDWLLRFRCGTNFMAAGCCIWRLVSLTAWVEDLVNESDRHACLDDEGDHTKEYVAERLCLLFWHIL